MTAQPGYDGRPVVLVHVLAREGSDQAYCNRVPYVPAPNIDPAVPRVLCAACRNGNTARPTPKCDPGCGTSIGWSRFINGKTQCEPCERAAVENGSRESGQ